MPSPTDCYEKMIRHLRVYEEIVIYENKLTIKEEERSVVTDFLEGEYNTEVRSYPYSAPLYDKEAASWAANTIYITAQLILHRENKESELDSIFPVFTGTVTPSAILSADLCLRFLPDMLLQLKMIDSEDKLIGLLENILQAWHYSGIKYLQSAESLDFTNITANKCLYQLYTDRVIEYRNLKLAKHPALTPTIGAALGDHGKIYWSDYKLETTINE